MSNEENMIEKDVQGEPQFPSERREVSQRPVIANYRPDGEVVTEPVKFGSEASAPTTQTPVAPAPPANAPRPPVMPQSAVPPFGSSSYSGGNLGSPTESSSSFNPPTTSFGDGSATNNFSNEPATHTFGNPSTFGPGAGGVVENESKSRKKSRPGWSALVAASVIAALAGGGIGVGAMTLRYEGSRPASMVQHKPEVKPVVDSKGAAPNWQAVSDAVGPSVVAINANTGRGEAAGSGVIFDEKGHILTNNHVVAGAEKLMVTLADGRVFDAKVVGKDPATDLAVIALNNAPKDLTVATLGDSSKVRVGDNIAAIGNPLGLSSTMTTGIVSALNRPVQTSGANEQTGAQTRVVTNAIQIDAAVNPGNSGGPVFDANGRVIGIASSIASLSGGGSAQSGSIGLGFAIPINLAENVAKQLVEKGSAEHAFLGVTIADGVAEFKGTSKLGAEVKSVEQGTPAAKANIQVGDVITAINGNPVASSAALTGYTRQYKSGDKVTVTFERNGDLQEVDVTLATRPDSQQR
ncbi:S1C family serine protease [Arcanobacterium ihumii]|uniref:S1C family serine protease n=1 Tax=Arcanobacterium ihumii TaxID=2138162 RepID=UPI001F19ED62|nr:trypsin-like peptidase domain-containing protein [Arcanobacterium ihumii]